MLEKKPNETMSLDEFYRFEPRIVDISSREKSCKSNFNKISTNQSTTRVRNWKTTNVK